MVDRVIGGAALLGLWSLVAWAELILEGMPGVLAGKDGIEQPHVLTCVFVDAGVNQAGILVPLEFVDGIVHQRTVEDMAHTRKNGRAENYKAGLSRVGCKLSNKRRELQQDGANTPCNSRSSN